MVVTYRGGATASYLVEVRGRKWRFDGVECLHDIMTWINEGMQPWTR